VLYVSTRCNVKTAHAQCVDIVVIRKMVSVEDYHLETDVRFAGAGRDTADRQEVLRGLSVSIVPVVVRHRVSFYTAFVLKLKLCHIHWLVSVQFVGDLNSRVPSCTSSLTETLLQSSKHIVVWKTSIN
jgi:hypothetical protein